MAGTEDHPALKRVNEELLCPICLETAQLPVNYTCFRGCGGRFSNNSTCLRSVLCLHCANDALQLGRPPPARFRDSGGFAHCLICRETRVDARMLTPDNAYMLNHNVMAIMDALSMGAACRRCDEDLESQSSLHQHYLRRCPAAVVKCRFRGCSHWHTRRAAAAHEETCSVGRAQCGQCGTWVDRTELLRHMVTTCRLRVVNCVLCKHSALLPDMLEHLRLHQSQLQGQVQAHARARAEIVASVPAAVAAMADFSSARGARALAAMTEVAAPKRPDASGGALVGVGAMAAASAARPLTPPFGSGGGTSRVVPPTEPPLPSGAAGAEGLARARGGQAQPGIHVPAVGSAVMLTSMQQQQLTQAHHHQQQSQQQQLQQTIAPVTQQDVQQQAQQLLQELLRRQQQQLLQRLQEQGQTSAATGTSGAARLPRTGREAQPEQQHTVPLQVSGPRNPSPSDLFAAATRSPAVPTSTAAAGAAAATAHVANPPQPWTASVPTAAVPAEGVSALVLQSAAAPAVRAAPGGAVRGTPAVALSPHGSGHSTVALSSSGQGISSFAIVLEADGVSADDEWRSSLELAGQLQQARLSAPGPRQERGARRDGSVRTGDGGGGGSADGGFSDVLRRRGAFWPGQIDQTAAPAAAATSTSSMSAGAEARRSGAHSSVRISDNIASERLHDGSGSDGPGNDFGDVDSEESEASAAAAAAAADEAARMVRTAAAIVRASAAASERRSHRQMALTGSNGGASGGGGGLGWQTATGGAGAAMSASWWGVAGAGPMGRSYATAAAAATASRGDRAGGCVQRSGVTQPAVATATAVELGAGATASMNVAEASQQAGALSRTVMDSALRRSFSDTELVFDVLEELVRASSNSVERGAVRISASGI